MKKLFIIILFAFSAINAQELSKTKSKNDELMLKLNQAFEIYGSIYRELIFNYVVDIDPEELMTSGIEGMLSALDPYTNYSSPNDNEEMDVIMSDMYVGIGIQTDTIDSLLTIVAVYKDSPAFKAGIRVGDRIFSVDGTYLLYSTGNELRTKTLGKKGTSLTMKLLREGVKDTLVKTLVRDDIVISNISNPMLMPKNIGYIKINQFASNSPSEFKSALLDLYLKNKLKGLIIDVRGNPGGLITSAVEICEFFLPHGIDIVKTKGKKGTNDYTYQSLGTPLDTNLPLVILIDENSASASEILAGAMQDYDRAVIAGTRSFGKGLVQSVEETPYGGSLKITTAKYYIPSGRCIQKLDYKIAKDRNGLSLHHDSVFHTRNGRPVFESSGIIPDVAIPHDSINEYCHQLEENLYPFRFANQFCGGLDSLPVNFTVDDKLLIDFAKYIKQSGFISEGDYHGRLLALRNDAMSQIDRKLISKMDVLLKDFDKVKDKDFETNKEYIRQRLTQEIQKRFYPEETIEKNYLLNDKAIIRASSIIEKGENSKILLKP